MRHLHSSRSVLFCRLAACSVLLFVLGFLFVMGAMVAFVVTGDPYWLRVLAFSLLSIPLSAVSCLVFASQFRCPLCLGPPLASRHCQRHRKARCLFGSYRLRTALEIIFTSTFRCSYCGESTAVRVRRKQ